jgi:predicted enzyme related to lactoylglutathione lyase
MPTRNRAPIGSPCWADLWTSDVDGSRRFYSELFGWEAQEPSAEFGGYFMFTRNGVPVSGGMGPMGDMPADDTWRVYLATDDITKTLLAAEAGGATLVGPEMAVADLGSQAVLVEPTGATVGVWQPGTFGGFGVLAEPGTPAWFELRTVDYPRAVGFHRDVFHWATNTVSDTDQFRYTTMRSPDGDGELAGILDVAGWAPGGGRSEWIIYWYVEDLDTAVATVRGLGGSVLTEPQDTPYGLMATVADPAGARFNLHTPSR